MVTLYGSMTLSDPRGGASGRQFFFVISLRMLIASELYRRMPMRNLFPAANHVVFQSHNETFITFKSLYCPFAYICTFHVQHKHITSYNKQLAIVEH